MGSRVRSGIVCQCGRVCGVSVSGVERQGEGNLEATITALGLSMKYRDHILVPRGLAAPLSMGHMKHIYSVLCMMHDALCFDISIDLALALVCMPMLGLTETE
jgi:hypothetical protein